MAQLSLDVLFRSIGDRLVKPHDVFPQLAAVDVSEATIIPATQFLDSMYSDGDSRVNSRAQTPMVVSNTHSASNLPSHTIRPVTGLAKIADSFAKLKLSPQKESAIHSIYSPAPTPSSKRHIPQVSNLPQQPSLDHITTAVDESADYAIVVSMFEVYNDRIFDLLTCTAMNSKTLLKDFRRRPLLFKNTEYSPDRKVVAGLRKIVCGSLEEALLVLETGLMERRVAGTGSNAASSRSHGFFCMELKKRGKSTRGCWVGSNMTVVDLAGRFWIDLLATSLSCIAMMYLHSDKTNIKQALNARAPQRQQAAPSPKPAR